VILQHWLQNQYDKYDFNRIRNNRQNFKFKRNTQQFIYSIGQTYTHKG